MNWRNSSATSPDVSPGPWAGRNTSFYGRESTLPHTQQEISGYAKDHSNVLQRMTDFGLPAMSMVSPVDEEPPLVASSYLEAAGRVLSFTNPTQGTKYQQKHEDNSRQLAGTFASVGSEQHPESVKDFLHKKRQECLEALIESEDSVRADAVRRQGMLVSDMEWDKFKEDALRTYAAAGNGGVVEMLRSQRRSALSSMNPSANAGDCALTAQEKLFARALCDYNDELTSTRAPTQSLCTKFCSVVENAFDKMAVEMWHALVTTASMDDGRGLLNQEQVINLRLSETFRNEIIKRARNYLEESAYKSAEVRIRSPLSVADTDPGDDSNLIVRYTRTQLSKLHSKLESPGMKLHGVPIWALIYHAIRVGAIQSAIAFCRHGDESCQEIVRYLAEYNRNNGRLLPTSQQELQTTYRSQKIAGSDDLYKRTVYGVLSRAEPEQDFGGITNSVSDWLWMKLAQTEGDASSNFSLPVLQQVIKQRFPEGKTSDVEAFLGFVLSGQFEMAIARLFHNLKFRIHAVHMSVALKDAGLLLCSVQPGNGNVIVLSNSLPLLDLSTIIRIYVDPFRNRDVEIAVGYFFHLRDTLTTKATLYDYQFQNLFELCVYKLAKEGNNYTLLFSKPGMPQKSMHKYIQDPSRLIIPVAQDFIQDGRLEEGLYLLEMVNQTTALFRTLIRVLSEDLTCPTTPAHRKYLLKLSTGCAERFRKSGAEEDTFAKNFLITLDLATFFRLFDDQLFRQALDVMRDMKLVPLEQTDVATAVTAYHDDFVQELKDCVPYAVLHTMHCLVTCYTADKQRILGSRMGAEVGASLKTANLSISGARLSDDLLKVQTARRKQSRAVLEFANKIAAPQLPNLMDLLIKLESVIC